MANLDLLEKSIPVAPIKIAALKGCEELGKTVNDYLVQFRKELMEHRTNGIAWSGYAEESFLIDCDCPRFGTGEAKGGAHAAGDVRAHGMHAGELLKRAQRGIGHKGAALDVIIGVEIFFLTFSMFFTEVIRNGRTHFSFHAA